MNQETTLDAPLADEERISFVAKFISEMTQIKKKGGTEIFYRGHADESWVLEPSIFRSSRSKDALKGEENEHLLFRDMVAHEPQNFSECKSALDYLVQMQHYGLPTRLLDMTMNPLVALFFACEKEPNKDGIVYQFSIPENKVKHYDSDTVSVLANLAKCKSEEVRLRLYPTCDLQGSFYDGLESYGEKDTRKKRKEHEAVCIAKSLPSSFFDGLSISEEEDLPMVSNSILRQWLIENSAMPFTDSFLNAKGRYKNDVFKKVWRFILSEAPAHDVISPYLEWFNQQPGIDLLLHQIRGEKPHFRPMIQPYELLGLYFVKAKYGNQRITNQMGAFLLFGLGLQSEKCEDGSWGPLFCGKMVHAEVPEQWIKKGFVIPKEEKKKIRAELANLGITESYIYPGMEQYAKELKEKYKLDK